VLDYRLSSYGVGYEYLVMSLSLVSRDRIEMGEAGNPGGSAVG